MLSLVFPLCLLSAASCLPQQTLPREKVYAWNIHNETTTCILIQARVKVVYRSLTPEEYITTDYIDKSLMVTGHCGKEQELTASWESHDPVNRRQFSNLSFHFYQDLNDNSYKCNISLLATREGVQWPRLTGTLMEAKLNRYFSCSEQWLYLSARNFSGSASLSLEELKMQAFAPFRKERFFDEFHLCRSDVSDVIPWVFGVTVLVAAGVAVAMYFVARYRKRRLEGEGALMYRRESEAGQGRICIMLAC